MQLSENAQLKFGQYRVEPIMFTNRIKEELAYTLRTNFENRTVFIPKQHEIREDLHSVRRITTAANNIRFDADHSANGHADRFWALALALHAAGNGSGEIHISTRKKLETLKITEGF
jgi:phage FluMu gp28-like protein